MISMPGVYRFEKYLWTQRLLILVFCLQLVFVSSCQKNSASGRLMPFDSVPTSKALNPLVAEISGIADSKVNPGFLWGQEDGGNAPQLYLIDHEGSVVKKIIIKGALNRDWEDMDLVNGDIYIAETGDNNLAFSEYSFYKFPEPPLAADTISAIENIRFQYADGSHDAEAFLVDPVTKDIYIITKREQSSRLYKLTYPYSLTSTNTASLVGTLPYSGVVSAAMAPDGKEIIVKTYISLNYYKRNAGERIENTLQSSFSQLPYKMEPQGEAVTFAHDNSGFFTLSEKGFSSGVNLYFYKRK